MADPDHVPEMDGFDRLTVGLYRTGLLAQAAALGGLAASEIAPVEPTWAAFGMLVAVALSAANLHLYDKRIRWVISTAGWIGAGFVAASGLIDTPAIGSGVLHYGGRGFLFVVTSALALKEQFCFRLPGLRAVPLMLAASVATGLMGLAPITAGLMGLAAVVVLLLAFAKLRMPTHVDIGNKAAYQV